MPDTIALIVTLQKLTAELVERVKGREFSSKVSDIELQQGQLKVEAENTQLKQLIATLQQAAAEADKKRADADEVRFHREMKFIKGKSTGGKWLAFCPKCNMPMKDGRWPSGERVATCSASCGFQRVYIPSILEEVAKELD
ncbi:MAG TPA: hypothetical protein VK846_01105 [Candidatus Limnocylindria bacterium]|nr:hypothetical protein [Candidatus Limnocylindria bacterium]